MSDVGLDALSERLEELYADGYDVLKETESNVPFLHWEDGEWKLDKNFLDKDWNDNDHLLIRRK